MLHRKLQPPPPQQQRRLRRKSLHRHRRPALPALPSQRWWSTSPSWRLPQQLRLLLRLLLLYRRKNLNLSSLRRRRLSMQ